jgi:hypothetical protein
MSPIGTNAVIPDGFERRLRQSPLTDPWEPLYSRRSDKAVIVGLRLAKPHTNGHGLTQLAQNRHPTIVKSMP